MKTLTKAKRRMASRALVAAAAATLAVLAAACYDNNTGRTEIGESINFKLPAFPETGGNAVQVFTEMHYQPSYRTQEGPRLLPPSDSVPVTGREIRYASLEEYTALEMPESTARTYDAAEAQHLYAINCQVCHGPALQGDGPIMNMWPTTSEGVLRGPVPANLMEEITRTATDGDLFAYISLGGRQGAAARIRDRRSTSPMPEFGLLLSEEERWALVQFLRSHVGR